MRRSMISELAVWKASPLRKPLVLRGARQVGKTYLLGQFGAENFENVVRLDFERNVGLRDIFSGDLDAPSLLSRIELRTAARIIPGQTLLVLDEIQACPNAVKSLKYFKEDMPSLHVAAAGSLLEMIMDDTSFPVGCVDFLWLRPLSFAEFLGATGNAIAQQRLPDLRISAPLHPSEHQFYLEHLRTYFVVGGMPEAVSAYLATRSLVEPSRVHASLMHTYVEDLHKYRGRMDIDGIENVLQTLPARVGSRIKYGAIAPDWTVNKTRRVLSLLERLMLVTPVRHSSAQALPLGFPVSEKVFKYVFLDIGLMQHQCGVPAAELLHAGDLLDVYRGALAEQFVGQELLQTTGASSSTGLHFWARDVVGSQAEVDYLMVREGRISPIEVKSGAGGRLRSLHLFLAEHPDCGPGYVVSSVNFTRDEARRTVHVPLYTKLC